MGLVALDAEARAAAIVVQTLGRALATSPEPRQVTAADAALARPLLSAFLAEAEMATAGTLLEGWVRPVRPGDRLPGAREALMLLPDGTYRVVRLTLDLGVGGRQGLLVLMLRLPSPPPEPRATAGPEATLGAQVLGARATLRAVLHRLHLPLAQAEALEVGQLLPLPGVTVASVQVEAGGVALGPARLGQAAGMRAIRIEAPHAPWLEELPASSSPSPAEPLPPEGPA